MRRRRAAKFGEANERKNERTATGSLGFSSGWYFTLGSGEAGASHFVGVWKRSCFFDLDGDEQLLDESDPLFLRKELTMPAPTPPLLPESLSVLDWKRQFRKNTLNATRSGGGCDTSMPLFEVKKTACSEVGIRLCRCVLMLRLMLVMGR